MDVLVATRLWKTFSFIPGNSIVYFKILQKSLIVLLLFKFCVVVTTNSRTHLHMK